MTTDTDWRSYSGLLGGSRHKKCPCRRKVGQRLKVEEVATGQGMQESLGAEEAQEKNPPERNQYSTLTGREDTPCLLLSLNCILFGGGVVSLTQGLIYPSLSSQLTPLQLHRTHFLGKRKKPGPRPCHLHLPHKAFSLTRAPSWFLSSPQTLRIAPTPYLLGTVMLH